MELKTFSFAAPTSNFVLNSVEGANGRYYYYSDVPDIYDALEYNVKKGSDFVLISYPSGEIYRPFKQKDYAFVVNPAYCDNAIYSAILYADKKTIDVFKIFPE